MIRKIWFRKTRPTINIHPKLVKELNWSTDDWLLMEVDGRNLIITKPQNNIVPVRLSKIGSGQYYMSFPLELPKDTRLRMFIKRVGKALSLRII